MVAALAAAQHGVVAFWQLIAMGLGGDAVDHRVRVGRLHRIHRGVFAVGHQKLSRKGELMAAALAYGPAALLSHWSAAELWGFTTNSRPLIDVVAATSHRTRRGTIFHQLATLDPDDRTKRDGIPVTSATRTLLDVATVAHPRQLTRIVDEAERSGWLNQPAVHELIERNRGRKGVGALRAALAGHDAGIRWTRSELEARFRRLCRSKNIPLPLFNVRVEGFLVDCFWPSARLIVELDGYDFHRTRTAFERDRRRDAYLKLKGYTVIRVGSDWLATAPEDVAATVLELLPR
jgi:very-short-patch-repair endonuclease